MVILGLNRGGHDASACLVIDGVLKAFINTERITRRRRESTRVWEAVRYCLEATGLSLKDIDLVVQNSYEKDLEAYDALIGSRSVFSPEAEFIRQLPRVQTVSHHLAHAFCGVGLAPFDECAVLVADGVGQLLPDSRAEAESYFHYRNGELRPLYERTGILRPDGLGFHSFDSLGSVYSTVATYLFGHWDHCGKVMGLAPYGRPSADMRTIVREQGPRFEFDLAFRDQLKGGSDYAPTNWQRDLERSQDLAYAVQRELEAALLHVTRWLHAQTRSQNLVLSGGVALNCVANARILAETPFERVFIPPPAGDDGIAIGCAFFGWLVLGRGAKTFALTHPYYGKTYAGERVRAALEREVLVDFSQPESLETFVAAQLASGKVLGWFQGASALGPRALGDRSILGDPRDPHLRDRLNLRVKHREPFRPYGASVLAESAAEYFAVWDDWPYMNMAVAVREEKKAAIPAVVHVDGSCRIQTVRRSDHPRFHRLLQEFHRRTGVPLILNTSFNRQGEPIVETPEDALRSFLNMELDGLVLEGYWAVSRLTDDSREAEELVRGCRLIVERAFDVVQHLYPDGVRECTARLPPPDHASGVSISHHVEQLLVHLDRAVSLRAAFRRLGIRRGSPDATAVTRELLKLHRLGWIRLTHVPGCSPGAQP